jgi:hypothetical protein
MADNVPSATRWLDEPWLYGVGAFVGAAIFVGFLNPVAGGLAGIVAGVVTYRWRKRFMEREAKEL